MKTLKLFYLTHCPYCRNARKALEELRSENSDYESVAIDWIEESEQPEIADKYDYYHVPAVFDGDKKLYEANPGESYDDCKAQLKEILDSVT